MSPAGIYLEHCQEAEVLVGACLSHVAVTHMQTRTRRNRDVFLMCLQLAPSIMREPFHASNILDISDIPHHFFHRLLFGILFI